MFGPVDVRGSAWPASWIAVARSLVLGTYSTPIAVPDSIAVIASTRCCHVKTTRPSCCAFVSAIEQIWSIIAGE